MSSDKRFHRLRSALGTTRTLTGTWAKAKTHKLRQTFESPDSWIEGGGDTSNPKRFQERKAKRSQLKQYHDIRVDGGVISTLLEARALMVFGTGGQFTSERDAVAEWLNDTLNDRDTLMVDIGTDSYFYGYSLGEMLETNGGDFGKVELIQPWTTVPVKDRQGQVQEWEQQIETENNQTFTQSFDPDDVLHFKTTKASGRDPVGMSMLGRAMDEAEAYHDHQAAINNAVEMQGFPKFHVQLGREDGAVIDDNELRRARPMFDNIHELTKWVTGRDVEIDIIEAENFDFEGITEHDLSKLAIAFMLPIELTQIGGGDGLGTGFPAKLRRQLFLLGARADQRLLGDQFVQQVGRPLLEQYAPDDLFEGEAADLNLEYVFSDPITDVDELNSQVQAIGSDMTVNERRDMFDLPPLDDEDTGESFESPGTPEPEPQPDAGETAFSEDTQLQRSGLSADLITWIRQYAEDRGSLDNTVLEMADWLETYADAPAGSRDRLRDGVTLWANAQGIDVSQAGEQPVGNLLSWLSEHRQLAEDDDVPDPATLADELDAYREGFETIVWGDNIDLAEPAFADDDDVPANVRTRLERAANRISWSDTDGAPPNDLREFFVKKLGQPQGWSVNSLSNGLRQEFGTFDGPDHRENIARTKSAQLLNEATDMAIDDLSEGVSGEVRVAWVGPLDDDTTDACRELQTLTDPEHGGNPLPRTDFDTRKASLAHEHFPDFEGSGEAIHWQERHRKEPFLPSDDGVEPAASGGAATVPGDD